MYWLSLHEEYAAAFFLLGDSPKDAITVCIKNLKDIDLAIAIARVYCGDGSPIARDLLYNDILPLALQHTDRWLASWAFWHLGERDKAVRAIISPLETLIRLEVPRNLEVGSIDSTDPSLIVLYASLRDKSLQTIKGSLQIDPQLETDFVLHCARMYSRMGCTLLSLRLISNWEFTRGASLISEPVPQMSPRAKRRGSVIIADIPSDSLDGRTLNKSKLKPVSDVPAAFDMSAFDF